jgi:hypothetical protein
LMMVSRHSEQLLRTASREALGLPQLLRDQMKVKLDVDAERSKLRAAEDARVAQLLASQQQAFDTDLAAAKLAFGSRERAALDKLAHVASELQKYQALAASLTESVNEMKGELVCLYNYSKEMWRVLEDVQSGCALLATAAPCTLLMRLGGLCRKFQMAQTSGRSPYFRIPSRLLPQNPVSQKLTPHTLNAVRAIGAWFMAPCAVKFLWLCCADRGRWRFPATRRLRTTN